MKKIFLLVPFIGMAIGNIAAQPQLSYRSEDAVRLGKKDNVSSYLTGKLSLSENHVFLDEGVSLRDSVLRTRSDYKDSLGITHMRLNQYYKGIPVEDAMMKIHVRDGRIVYSNGEYVHCENIDTRPTFSSQAAVTKALQIVNARLNHAADDTTLIVLKEPKLVLSHSKNNSSDTTLYLCYKVGVYSKTEVVHDEVYIDAKSGAVIGTVSNLISHNGRAETRYSGVRTINTSHWLVFWYKLEQSGTDSRNIRTVNMNTRTDFWNNSSWTHFKDGDNDWDSDYNNRDKDNGALDAYWGLERTYDYFKTVHGWRGLDGNNCQIDAAVHYGYKLDNAYWDRSYGVLLFGDGNVRDIYTSLDIVAHEFGHGVCQFTANLSQSGEPAALNEGLSDIWGACVEQWATTGKQTWKMGEDIGSPIRIMSNPMTYKGNNWNDNADCHVNAGVLDYWFYLLAHGGSGTNDHGRHYNVTGIGMEKAAKIVFRAETSYMTSSTNYQSMCEYTIRAARELYSGQEISSTIEAWRAVGLLPDYYTKDNSLDDGMEPLHYLSEGYQNSPDIWLRRNADNGTAHQKARHNSVNYVYVNVHNRGLTQTAISWPSWVPQWMQRTDSIELYVKKASLSIDSWPQGWQKIGCVAIPALASGQTQTVRIDGHFPSVGNGHPIGGSVVVGNDVNYAMLTRIVSSKDIITYPEVDNTLLNVINNNNISYKNVVVSSAIFMDDIYQQRATLDIDNTKGPLYTTDIRFTSPSNEEGAQLFKEAEVRMVFDRELLDFWQAEGAEFVDLKPVDDTTFLVLSSDAVIKGAVIPEDYYGAMNMQINFLTKEYSEKFSYEYQITEMDPKKEQILASASIVVYKNPRDVLFEAKAGDDQIVKKNTRALLSAETIDEEAVYNWYDARGELIGSGDTLSVDVTETSKYKLEVIAKADGYKDYDSVYVIATYGSIEGIAPNPANMQTVVTYDLSEEVTSATIVVANAAGHVLYSAPLDVTQTSHIVNLQAIPAGQYIVRIESQGTPLDTKTLIVY